MKVLLNKLLRVLSPVQLIALYYFFAVSVSVILISLPIAHQDGVDWSFMDALFTAVSAVSVTGLTVVDTADTFSTAGIWILAFVLQFGGIGIMTLGTFVWLIFGKRIGLKERRLIMTDQNQSNLSGVVKLMKHVLILIVAIEFFGGLILGTYFLKYFDSPGEAFIHGFFTSISATTNAGFDITGDSMIPYRHDYFVQFIVILLLIFGAIGFPVLTEVKDFLFSRERKFTFSLFTKLTTVTFFLLVFGGAIGIYVMEARFSFLGKSWHEILFFSLFQSAATRSGDSRQWTSATLRIQRYCLCAS